MTSSIRAGLATGLLFLACLLGLQAGFLLRQIGETFEAQSEATLATVVEARNTLSLTRAMLAQQGRYYRDSASHIKALTKAAAIDAVLLGRLIERADARLERMTSAAEIALAATQDAAGTAALQAQRVGEDSHLLLEAATATTQQLERLVGDASLPQAAVHLEAATANLEATTAAAAEATGSIRDMLSPTQKSFWRRLLELMIPRPTVRVK